MFLNACLVTNDSQPSVLCVFPCYTDEPFSLTLKHATKLCYISCHATKLCRDSCHGWCRQTSSPRIAWLEQFLLQFPVNGQLLTQSLFANGIKRRRDKKRPCAVNGKISLFVCVLSQVTHARYHTHNELFHEKWEYFRVALKIEMSNSHIVTNSDFRRNFGVLQSFC